MLNLPPKEVAKVLEKDVIFRPNPGPQTEFLEANEDEVLFAGGRGPLVYGEKVLTPYGFKSIEDITVQDKVVCPDNTIANILDIPFDGEDSCFEIEFMDGRKIQCGQDHLWAFEVSNRTLKAGSKRQRVTTTKDLFSRFNRYKATKTPYRILLPLTAPVNYGIKQELIIAPYTLGVLIGDGSFRGRSISLTSADEQLVSKVASQGYAVSTHKKDIQYGVLGLTKQIAKLGLYDKLSNAKFIPKEYLTANIEDRFELLKGLMDTDGYTGGNGCEYTTVSEQLVKDVQQLVWSLGGKATLFTKLGSYKKNNIKIICQKVYRLYIQFQDSSNIFYLDRKKKVSRVYNGGTSKLKLRIKNITPIGVKRCKCITIDHPDHLFITTNFVVTHNSGKSDALIVDPLRYCGNKNFRALVIRKTMPELRDLIHRAREIYPQAYEGVKWKEQEKIFIFPSGARIEFGYLETDIDVERYRGQQYTWIGIDELTLFPREETIDRLMGSARTIDSTLRVQKRYSTNPNGPGRSWVKRRFIDKSPPGVRFTDYIDTPIGRMPITRKWINSKTQDNPILMDNNPGYIVWLSSLPENLRKAWLDADWNVAEGVAFPDFDSRIHVVKPFPIPSNWLKFRCCDWGFTSMAVCLWIAADEDNNLYVYREYKTKLVTADRFASNVLALEAGEKVRYGIIDGSVGDQRGISGPTVDEQMRLMGCIWRYADKHSGSRIAGKNLIHRYLSLDEFTGQPKLKIFDTCKELVEELSSLPTDENNAEDVDTDCADHAYDALRYGIMSRPSIVSTFDSWAGMSKDSRPTIIDPKFGY